MKVFASAVVQSNVAWLAVCALILPMPISAVTPPARESYFGIVGQECPIPDLRADPIPDMRPDAGTRSVSSVSVEDSNLVESLISAVLSDDNKTIGRVVSTQWLASTVAKSCISAIKSAQSVCTREPLYLLGDLEVRISWVCGRKVSYFAFITIKNKRVTNIWAEDKTKPPQVIPCTDPSKATNIAVWNGAMYEMQCRD